MYSITEENIIKVLTLTDEVREMQNCIQVLKKNDIDNGIVELYEKIGFNTFKIKTIKNYNENQPKIEIKIVGADNSIIQIKTKDTRTRLKLSKYGDKVFYLLKGLNTGYELEMISQLQDKDLKKKYLLSIGSITIIETDILDRLCEIIFKIKL